MSKPTVVIVPGAWQLASEYEPFGSPLAGLKEDARALGEVLTRLAEEGRDIVVLCHSYGGLVGSCASEGIDLVTRKSTGKTGGVKLIIYMSAFMVPKGMTIFECLGGKPLPWMNIEGDRCTPVVSQIASIGFNDLPQEKALVHAEALTHTSMSAFTTPSTFEPWANGVPCAYIFFEIDSSLQLPVQQHMAAQLGPNANTFNLKAGHCPFLSMPEELQEVVVKAVQA